MFDGGEVGGSIFGSHTAFIVAEDHIQHPMQAILDCPVAAHDRRDAHGWITQGGDVEARCKTACKPFQIPGVNSAQKFPPWSCDDPAFPLENLGCCSWI